MPKGKTSRPTNRATKKIMNRTKNKTVSRSRGDAGHWEHNKATGRASEETLAEKQRENRRAGARFDKAEARKIKESVAARKRKKESTKKKRK